MLGVEMKHTTATSVMFLEEKAIVAHAAQAISGAANPKIFGATGEKGILILLRRYLPSCFRASSGHALDPTGQKSPEIDIMILDSRFAPLSVHQDGTTLEMKEAVLGVVSVKKRLDKASLSEQDRYAKRVHDFFSSQHKKDCLSRKKAFDSPVFYVLSYLSVITEATVFKHLRAAKGLSNPLCILFCMAMPLKGKSRNSNGAIFRYDGTPPDTKLFSVPSTAAVSDFYFMMLQDAYYSMDSRKLTFTDLGELTMRYYKWARDL
jgi:hypothetical protein